MNSPLKILSQSNAIWLVILHELSVSWQDLFPSVPKGCSRQVHVAGHHYHRLVRLLALFHELLRGQTTSDLYFILALVVFRSW